MKDNIYIYEDEGYKNFLPLVWLKPVFDLYCGLYTFKERIQRLYPEANLLEVSRFQGVKGSRHHLSRLSRSDKRSGTESADNAGGLFINGRAILYKKIPIEGNEEVFISKDEMVGFRGKWEVRKGFLDDIKKKYKIKEIHATIIKYPWELIAKNKERIVKDYKFKEQGTKSKVRNVSLYGDVENLYVGKNVIIEDGVYLNVENGPIYIGNNVRIRPPTIIDGPCYVGDGSLIDGAKIRSGTTIGKECKIGGEVEESIFSDYSNKHHEGFVGHSYIGEWVNLGAGTITSDLKNTYGTVKIQNSEARNQKSEIDTGLIKLGAFIGDHTKTGIGTLLTTGCIIGCFANIYGGGTFPKYVPPFTWGTNNKFATYKFEKALEVTKRAMARRGITLTQDYIKRIKEAFELTEKERRIL
ncbi:hypothetical protein KAW65_01925 [candidate division WOR-3 bacterium]|nr:hypothetical protein [candidate division WOR-3 bacterium]